MERLVKYTSRDEWLKGRSSYIGGSELATIMGLNKYQSPYQLWLLKTGREQPMSDNKHTLSGRFLEDGIARYWEHETGNKIIEASANDNVYIHNLYDFLRGTPDRRFFWGEDRSLNNRAVLEVKTTMKIIDHNDIPMGWFIQPNYYTGLIGYNKFVIVWFEFMTKELKWQEYDFDQELFDISTQEAVDFWNNHIVTDVPPPMSTVADAKILYPESKEGKVIVASDEVIELYSQAINLNREMRERKNKYNDIADRIKMIMKDSEKLVTQNLDTLFTYKTTSRGRTLLIKEL